MKRSMIVKLGGSLSITCLPDKKVRIKAVNGPKTREKEITLDEEFSDETADGGTATVRCCLSYLFTYSKVFHALFSLFTIKKRLLCIQTLQSRLKVPRLF